MPRDLGSKTFNATSVGMVMRIPASPKVWITLSGAGWNDGVLVVKAIPPGVGDAVELVRIPAPGVCGPISCEMAAEIQIDVSTADASATSASVSVIGV